MSQNRRGLGTLPVVQVLVFLALCFLATTTPVFAATFTSAKSGNWSDPVTWGNPAGGAYPQAGDTVTIQLGHTVTVDTSSAVCATLNVGTVDNSTSTLSFSSGSQLTVDAALNVGGDLLKKGAVNMTAGGVLNVGGTASFSSGNGTLTAGLGTVNYGAPGPQTVAALVYNNLTLSGSGTKSTSGVAVNGLLSMEGTAVANTAPIYGASAALQYKGSAAQTTGPEFPATWTGSGGVSIANSSGTVALGGAKVVNAGLAVNSGATLNTSPANYALTFGGNFSNNGTFTANGSAIAISGTGAQSIAGFSTTGAVSMTKTGGVATLQGNVSGGALSINGSGGTLNLGTGLTHTFTGTWTRTAGTLQGGSSTLKLGASVSGSGGTFTAGTGTVDFNGAGAQTVPALDYYGLTIGGSRGSNAVTLPNGGTIRIAGPFNAGANTYVTTGNIVEFNGSSAQTIPSFAFTGLTVNNAAGVLLSGDVTVNGPLVFTNGKMTTGANKLIFGADGTWSNANSSKYVIGGVQKNYSVRGDFVFPVGDSSAYSPVTVTPTAGFASGSLTVSTTSGDHPSISAISSPLVKDKSVNRYWSLAASGGLSGTYGATFSYPSSQVDSAAVAASFKVARFNSNTWTTEAVNGTPTTTSTSIMGETGFGDFAIADPKTKTTLAMVSPVTGILLKPGANVTYSANVSWTGAETPSGTVYFRDGGTSGSPICSGTLAGTSSPITVSCVSAALSTQGPHTIYAVYDGDAIFQGVNVSITVTVGDTTLAVISGLDAYADNGRVYVQWETTTEAGTAGFYLYRLGENEEWEQVNEDLAPGFLNTPVGGTYRLMDPGAKPGRSYTYQLVEVEHNGGLLSNGPYSVTASSDSRPSLGTEKDGFSSKLHALAPKAASQSTDRASSSPAPAARAFDLGAFLSGLLASISSWFGGLLAQSGFANA